VPLFPLSNVVLFPRAVAPLHIFEPRYRQMTEAALDTDRVIAMVTVRPEHVEDIAGDPPIYPIGCAGFIQSYQKLADGRLNLLLQGMHRVRIDLEVPRTGDRLFRIGEVSDLEDPVERPERCAELRGQVARHLSQIVGSGAGQAMEQTLGRLEGMDPQAFADGVCQALTLETAEKQALLDANSIDERLHRLEGALGFHLAMMERGASGDIDPESVH
jgi:hypothetical protein